MTRHHALAPPTDTGKGNAATAQDRSRREARTRPRTGRTPPAREYRTP
ncbi:hypothetical protein P8A22_06290 [Streptomyces laculatispora]|uniref:Uncharacterized protein n=1 Tax=Streptomyces laculatispora TaxID=887464 RepID=A0ABY9HYG9_9ACTN|nr:hypothetical protein [Streptomyces laculatispora]WLQ39645.1 hypothetical protein P8A22_06290 [Streptomyces laculatispora]